jgi:hypothetical protein
MVAGIKATRNHVLQMTALGPQTAVSLAPFTSIELRSGVKAVLQHGPVQSLALIKGDQDTSRIAVEGSRLIIDKCRNKCPRGYQLEVEIVTPAVVGITVRSGGTVESRGSFPRQAEISLAVSNGGTIDARSILATSVAATVNQGGAIFAKPQTTMVASVSNGGVIRYWGDAQVTSSTEHGGQISKGAPADADKPLSDFGATDSCSPKPPKSSHVRSVVID